MEIKERKIREVGNSVVLTISKEFLAANGLSAGDEVYVDEDKLKNAITKKTQQVDDVDFATAQALNDYNEAFESLVDK
ncbi:addiction module antitoxin [Enterococcus sp. AZ163]|uniref:addiction module antitoxin n=1 Tax=Enterococcus sp. AZ163 TaxID=2774638 RepID=UPI003D2A596B